MSPQVNLILLKFKRTPVLNFQDILGDTFFFVNVFLIIILKSFKKITGFFSMPNIGGFVIRPIYNVRHQNPICL